MYQKKEASFLFTGEGERGRKTWNLPPRGVEPSLAPPIDKLGPSRSATCPLRGSFFNSKHPISHTICGQRAGSIHAHRGMAAATAAIATAIATSGGLQAFCLLLFRVHL